MVLLKVQKVCAKKLKKKMTQMNSTLKRTILLAFSLTLVMVVSVTAEGVGLKVGERAKYTDFLYTWNMPEGVSEPAEFASLKDVDWSDFEVQNIDGTTVTVKSITRYKNGTEESETLSGNVKTGAGNLSFVIIEANLNPGDKLPLEFWPEAGVYINGTVSRTYAGVSRSVNYIDITVTEWDVTNTLKLYWDKAKGILCEMLMSMTYTGTDYSMSVSFKMSETNMWGGAGLTPAILTEWWVLTIIAVVIITVCITAFAVHTRARTRIPPPPPLPTPTEHMCPACGQPLIYVPQYQRWYCQNCKKYS